MNTKISIEKIMQTESDPGKGNCFSACLAMILGLSIEEVPNFREKTHDSDEYIRLVQEYLKQFGLYVLTLRLDGEELAWPGVPDGAIVIAGGKSPRFGHLGVRHACIGKIVDGFNFELIHDPYPGGEGFASQNDITSYWFFIEFIPSRNRRVLQAVSDQLGREMSAPFCPGHRLDTMKTKIDQELKNE